MRKRRRKNRQKMNRQGDFFAPTERFPVRRAWAERPPGDLSLRIKTAMGQALKECPDSAAVIALRMTEITGREISEAALYTYTAPSKPEHDIGITRFVAFVRATGATWLWDELVRDDGLTVLEGREAKLAEVGHLRQQRQLVERALRQAERDLEREPVRVRPRRGHG